LGQGLEGDEGEAESGCGGVEASVVLVGGLFSAVFEALEKDYGGEERERGEKGSEENEIDVHGRPFAAGAAQAWIGAPIKAAATCPVADGSGLRGRRTLEEGGTNELIRCNNVVRSWFVTDGAIDQFGKEE
jgi:hypothetical protein